jgi:zinc protease
MRIWILGLAAALLLIARPAFAMPIETVTSKGGISAWLVQDHSLPVISFHFSFRGGAASDPVPGLTIFAVSLLDEGAGDLDSGQFQGKLADLSADLGFDADEDRVAGSVKTLTQNRDAVFELLRLALTAPRFDAPAVDRIRAELDQGIESETQTPDSIVHDTWFRTQFPGHPYAIPRLGTRESVDKIAIDQLKAWAKTRLGRDRLKVAVVGDITSADLATLLDHVFGALPATASGGTEPADVTPAGGGKLILVRKPIPQSVAFFGQHGIGLHDPDIYAAMVVNHVLGGGGFTSRLEEEVREKRGLAYGIYTALGHQDHVDYWGGRVGTRNEKMAETVAITRAEWAKLAKDGPTDAEVAQAKTYLDGSYTLGLNSTGSIATRLLSLQENGFPPDYFERRPKLIAAVTTADAKRVAAKLLDPGNLSFVVVGDPKDLKADQVIDGGE